MQCLNRGYPGNRAYLLLTRPKRKIASAAIVSFSIEFREFRQKQNSSQTGFKLDLFVALLYFRYNG